VFLLQSERPIFAPIQYNWHKTLELLG
jgi:hypothetical protein